MDALGKEKTDSMCCQSFENDEQRCCSQENEKSLTCPAQASLDLCQKELAEWRDKYMRAHADFDNFKRRSEKEKMLWMRTGQTEIIMPLLSIVDDFDRALLEQQKVNLSPDMVSWLTGFTMIGKALHKFLLAHGIEEITEVIHFDPELHEAISSIEVPGKNPGEIIEILQKGYRFKGEVVRPVKVAVAQ